MRMFVALFAAALLSLGWGTTTPHGQLLFATPINGYLNVATLDVATGRVRAVLPAPMPEYLPAWSPDGSRIAFAATVGGVTQIFVVNADGSDPRQLTNDDRLKGGPAWSPDGTRIAFLRNDYAGITFGLPGSTNIIVMNSDGSNFTRVTQDPAAKRALSWSPDGTKFAYTIELADRVGVVSADGKEKH